MTAGEVIALVDALRPNQYGEEQKLRWLRRLDGQILAELEDTHRPNDTARSCGSAGTAASTGGIVSPLRNEPGSLGFVPIEETEDDEAPVLDDAYTVDTELLAPFPYDEELYTAYLFCQIDLHNAEIQKYNQSLSLLAAAWRQLADWINRSRRPRGAARFKF